MRFYGERGREEEGREAQGGRTRVTKRIERIRRGRTLPKWVIRDAVCFQSPAESFMPAIIPGYAWRTGRREGGREGGREGEEVLSLKSCSTALSPSKRPRMR